MKIYCSMFHLGHQQSSFQPCVEYIVSGWTPVCDLGERYGAFNDTYLQSNQIDKNSNITHSEENIEMERENTHLLTQTCIDSTGSKIKSLNPGLNLGEWPKLRRYGSNSSFDHFGSQMHHKAD